MSSSSSTRAVANEHWLSVQLPGKFSLFYLCIQKNCFSQAALSHEDTFLGFHNISEAAAESVGGVVVGPLAMNIVSCPPQCAPNVIMSACIEWKSGSDDESNQSERRCSCSLSLT